MTRKVEYVLDTPVDCLTMSDIESDITKHMAQKKTMVLASVNPQIILMSEKNSTVKAFLQQASHRFADGIGVVKVSGWTNGSINERIAGIDVMEKVLEYSDAHHTSIFLYGAKPDVVKKASDNIKLLYPGLSIAGVIDGYTTLTDKEIINTINQSQADCLFVALGSPRQEEWLQTYMPELTPTIFQTVGGSFDVFSGEVKRAPEFFIKTNLEWVYRSMSNPKRFNRLFQAPLFIAKGLMWHQKQSKE